MILQNTTSNDVLKAREKALRYLARHEVTRWELFKWLKRKGYPKRICKEVVRYCLENQYLKDKETLRWRLQKAWKKGWGRDRVMMDWKQKGVPDHVIEAYIDRHYPLKREIKVCRTWIAHQKRKRNILRKLVQRGFSQACIESCWESWYHEES